MTMAKDDDANLLGKRIAIEAIEDEALREHYEKLERVDYDQKVNEVAGQKKQQYMTATLRKVKVADRVDKENIVN